MRKGNFSRLTFQDLYYDGVIDERSEWFDEDQQQVIKKRSSKNNKNRNANEKYIEEFEDDYYLRLKRGEIERIR